MPRATFFDVNHPAAWKWPAAAFGLVVLPFVAANAVERRWRRETAGPTYCRGWPYEYWTRYYTGTTRFRLEEALWNVAVSALLALAAAAAVRWFGILQQGTADEANHG